MSISLIGDIFCDIVASNLTDIPSWGEDALCKDISIVAGGSALNSAVHGANFSSYLTAGVQINTFGVVGRDTQGDICMKSLRQHSLIVNHVIEKSDLSTGTCIVMSGKQDRLFVTSRGCLEEMSLDWFSEDVFQNNCTHIHSAGFYNFSRPVRQSWRDLFKEAKQRGISTSLNPQYDAAGLWTDISELCVYLDFLITNEIELLSITKQTSSRKGAEVVCSWGCKCVVVTNSAGAIAFIDATHFSSEKGIILTGLVSNAPTSDPIAPKDDLVELHQSATATQVRDTCGAGDAFAGAFLVQLLHSGGDLKAALQSGCVAGTAAVQLVGGSTVPSFELLDVTSALLQSSASA